MALAFGLGDSPRAVAADERLQFTGTTLTGTPFNGASLQGKPAVLWFWRAAVPVLQPGGPVAEPGRGGRSQGDLRRCGGPLRSKRPMQDFVSKYNLNFTNLNDADGSIWQRFNVPWQPAMRSRSRTASSTFVNNPTSAMSQQEFVRTGSPHSPPILDGVMNQGLLGLAFGAGLVAALNPCGFALLPAYLALVVRDGEGRRAHRGGTCPGSHLGDDSRLSCGLRRVRAAHRDDRGDRRALFCHT